MRLFSKLQSTRITTECSYQVPLLSSARTDPSTCWNNIRVECGHENKELEDAKGLDIPLFCLCFQKVNRINNEKLLFSAQKSSRWNRGFKPGGINLRDRNRQGLKLPTEVKTEEASFQLQPHVRTPPHVLTVILWYESLLWPSQNRTMNPAIILVWEMISEGTCCRIESVLSVR